jgi:hypothetical protein
MEKILIIKFSQYPLAAVLEALAVDLLAVVDQVEAGKKQENYIFNLYII